MLPFASAIWSTALYGRRRLVQSAALPAPAPPTSPDADVPVRAEGPFAALLSGTYENTHIFEVMVEAYGFETTGAEAAGD